MKLLFSLEQLLVLNKKRILTDENLCLTRKKFRSMKIWD